jgi:hypothetical protein
VNRVRAAGAAPAPVVDELAAVPVELGGRTRFVRRADVRFAEAQGDYVRLHTRGGRHLVRIPISRLEEHWRGVGYVRVHRSYLLAVHAVQELRSDVSGGLLAHTTSATSRSAAGTPRAARPAARRRHRGEFDSGRGGTAMTRGERCAGVTGRPGQGRRGGSRVTSPQTRVALGGAAGRPPALPPRTRRSWRGPSASVRSSCAGR